MRQFLVLSLSVGLVACGSGGGSGTAGGSGGGGFVRTVPFVAWNDVQPNTEIVAPAISIEANYTQSLAEQVTSVSPFVNYSGIEYRQTSGPDGAVTRASVTTGDGDRLVFDRSQGATFTPLAGGFATFAENANETAFAIAVEPLARGWNYQTFGVWGRDSARGNPGRIGAISTGNFTPANNIPATGTAAFGGAAAGVYLSPGGGQSSLISADMGLAVNFATRSVAFVTINTVASSDGGQRFFARPSLDLVGNMQLVPGQNLMVGTVSTNPDFFGQLSGDITGKFYGPNAQEVGGTFGLRGSGVETYIGGFGGKR